MLGENNNNNTLPVFLNENAFQYPTNTSNQLQLFGNLPVGFNVNPTNYFGGEHNTALVRPNKRVKDAETIPMQQKLQISLNNNVGLDEADPPVRISAAHNPVSTGLRLSYDDDERNSSVTSSGSMNASSSVMLSLTDDFKTELDNQKREFDQYLKTQEETLTKGLREIKRRHMASFLGVMQKGISNKLHEKDVELENINRKNKELIDRIKQTASEAQNWCYRAKYNESVATMLKANLQRAMHSADQAKEGFGDSEMEMDDATSGGVHPKFGLSVGAGGGGSPAKPPPQQARELLICRGCKSKEVSILLLPCRHLCLCVDCEGSVSVCPVCQMVTATTVRVYLS
ncbi:PREDICTED: BOI-related E3 ubiquitin-protein ligase 1-like isoform X2 [Ipomoea nil]|uniref:BOI-related E3 ubiquitin-protein ligase 1-like isoform X2 n=1 Tax=Ipomoea nil TaxID=35883 RepID=UPI000901809B|nr:PREDICTED: BOI-related E3 ubiquitin-protein ligase 1-like isoform X2 [Ipomoea nil]XP_019176640.1 PREDICTED: BOI-related E3 ubiquitin-protein ligase 1-like isoform X2 [Ipomoea nil]